MDKAKWLTIAEVADVTGASAVTIRKRIERGLYEKKKDNQGRVLVLFDPKAPQPKPRTKKKASPDISRDVTPDRTRDKLAKAEAIIEGQAAKIAEQADVIERVTSERDKAMSQADNLQGRLDERAERIADLKDQLDRRRSWWPWNR